MTTTEADPPDLLPGDVVLRLSEHEEGSCHCDVRVTVARGWDPPPPGPAVTEIEVDPCELLPWDTVVRLTAYDRDGCHCDVRVVVAREEKSWLQREFERGDPDGAVRAAADAIIEEMREDEEAMSHETATFRANGHQARVADGEAVVFYRASHGIGPYCPRLDYDRCGTCDARLTLRFGDDEITVTEPCPYPDGITTTITLAVPSGKLIVTDDLRPVYDWRDRDRNDPEGMAGYNSSLGQHQAILTMAAAGCAYGPVGNSCPGLYLTGEGTYVIASAGYDEDADQEVRPDGWLRLAGVITDLWAYSIADYEDWKARGGDGARFARQEPGWDWDLVSVPPGTYQFTHHTGERSFDQDASGTVIYADITLVKEPAP